MHSFSSLAHSRCTWVSLRMARISRVCLQGIEKKSKYQQRTEDTTEAVQEAARAFFA